MLLTSKFKGLTPIMYFTLSILKSHAAFRKAVKKNDVQVGWEFSIWFFLSFGNALTEKLGGFILLCIIELKFRLISIVIVGYQFCGLLNIFTDSPK